MSDLYTVMGKYLQKQALETIMERQIYWFRNITTFPLYTAKYL